jgi:hypothetical protein
MNTADQPQVSVVIPAHNAAVHISAALRSVFAQTFSNFEVILVNDGSSDTEILEQILQPYLPRIRYIRQQNRGPSAARNAGIREARGKYVAFLDSDDLWLPHHLAKQMEILQTNVALGLIYANAIQFQRSKPVGIAFETVPQFGEPTLDTLLTERCTVNTSSAVVLRDALLQSGLFDETMNRCEDFDLWLRLSCAGIRMTYDREIHLCHRLGEGLTANTILMKQSQLQVYQKTIANQSLSRDQQNIVEKKLNNLEQEIQIEMVKSSLLAGQYQQALFAATKTQSTAPSRKLRLAMQGLRYCPALLRHAYTIYLRVLESSKRTKQESFMKELKIEGETVDFESLLGHWQAIK